MAGRAAACVAAEVNSRDRARTPDLPARSPGGGVVDLQGDGAALRVEVMHGLGSTVDRVTARDITLGDSPLKDDRAPETRRRETIIIRLAEKTC